MMHWWFPLLVAAPWLTPFAPAPSSYGVPWLVTLWCAGLAVAGVGLFRPDRRTLATAWARGLVLAGLVSAVIGLAQYNGLAAQWAVAMQGWINVGQVGEAYGHLRQRNLFASLMNIALAASTFLPWQQPRPWRVSSWLMWSASALVLVSANMASASRTGLIQLLGLALLCLLFAALRRAPRLLAALAAFTLLLWGAALWAVPRLLGPADALTALGRMTEANSCENRLVLWFNVMELISHKPLLGWGWGELDWAHHMAVYQWDAFGGPHRFCALLDNAHNLFLHLAVEGGLLLALMVSLWGGWLVWRNKPWREQDPHRLLAWAVLLLIGLHSMLEYPLWYGPFVTATLCCLLVLLPSGWFAAPLGTRWAAGLVGACVLGLSAFLTWDYHRISQYFLPVEARSPWTEHKPLALADPSRLFQSQLDFARLATLTVTAENAAQTKALALRILHYSPEPRVIEQLLLAALLTGDEGLYRLHAARYQQSYPEAYAKWRSAALSSSGAGASRR